MAGIRSGVEAATLAPLFDAESTAGLDDAALLARVAAGDRDSAGPAFAALAARHGPMVLRACRAVLRDAHDADDAFQATFLILARRAGSIRRPGVLAAWLHAVARRVALTARAAADRRRRREADAARALPRTTPPGPADDLGALIHEELGRLPAPQRTAVVLCCLEGLTQPEAAERAGWPLGTLQSRLARGRSRLRARLIRRGVAPALALAAAESLAEAAPLAVPPRLALAAARLALDPALAPGTIPAAVRHLAAGAHRAMTLARWKSAAAPLLAALGLLAAGATARPFAAPPGVPATPPAPPPAPPAAVDAPPDGDGLLTIAGKVVLPDREWDDRLGVTVTAAGFAEGDPQVVRPDGAGRFEVRGLFGLGGLLHARTADGSLQAMVRLPPDAARSAQHGRIALRLWPAESRPVEVEAGGRPVAGATVVARWPDLMGTTQARTDDRGRALLRWPAGAQVDRVVAWHPALGAGQSEVAPKLAPDAAVRVSLVPPEPRAIRLVDAAGRGVAGLELTPYFWGEGWGWIGPEGIAEARVRTDADGLATVPWSPAGARSLDVPLGSLRGDAWRVDAIDPIEGPRPTAVHLLPMRTVTGRLAMPGGAEPAGILVTGTGFGPGNRVDKARARARRDGTFALRVNADHGYALGVTDMHWASDLWTGLILPADGAEPAEVVIPVHHATPATIRVSRGPRRSPVAHASIEVGHEIDIHWVDAAGKPRSARSGTHSYSWTEADGAIQVGLAPGDHKVRLSTPTWDEEQVVTVAEGQPGVRVEFHRPWLGDRRVAGRLVGDPPGSAPSPDPKVLAWDFKNPYAPERFRPEVRPGGAFELVRDSEAMAVLVEDPASGRAGFARAGRGDDAVEVAMRPTASYAGTIVDADGRPLADREVGLGLEVTFDGPIARARTDAAGRFRFDGVPAGLALDVRVRADGQDPWPSIFRSGINLAPGEVRTDARLATGRPADPDR